MTSDRNAGNGSRHRDGHKSSRRRWAHRAAAVWALITVLLLALSGTAAAVPDDRWRSGQFTVDAPVYAVSTDGLWCHLSTGLACDSAQRQLEDPAPAWYGTADDPLRAECWTGTYLKIHQADDAGDWDREGWVLSEYVRFPADVGRVHQCSLLDLWGSHFRPGA